MSEVKIRDYERDEVVGRVSDSGIETHDDLLSDVVGGILTDDDTIRTIHPGEEPGEYRNIEVGITDEGFVRIFVDQLPSPFDIDDYEKLEDLPIYTPEEIQEKGIQVVDLEKKRVYIDAPAEAPSGVEVQEGQQGGLYYVPVGEEDDQESVDTGPEDMINVDAEDIQESDYVSVDGIEGFASIVENVGGKVRIEFSTGEVAEVSEAGDVFINDDREPADEEPSESDKIADQMEVDDFPNTAMMSVDDVRNELSHLASRTDESVRDEVFSTVRVSDDSPVSLWDRRTKDVKLSDDADGQVLAHEIGHAAVGVFDSEIKPYANVTANLYSRSMLDIDFENTGVIEWAEEEVRKKIRDSPLPVTDAREKYEGLLNRLYEEFDEDDTFELDDFKLEEPNEEAPDELRELISEANNTFERQHEGAKDDAEDDHKYYIGKPYSSMNAHETVSMTQEVLQGGAADRQAIENLFTRHSSFFEAWLEIFEPDYVAKNMINDVYEEYSDTDIFDDTPYPEAQE